jgi:hypothetical protein
MDFSIVFSVTAVQRLTAMLVALGPLLLST